jgi:hypothetical protein
MTWYSSRISILFFLGLLFSIIIDHLQAQHNITSYPTTPTILSSTHWLPLVSGFSAILVAFCFPLLDLTVGKKERVKRDWSSVIRCCGGFIGVNYAASKLPWTSSIQVSITLALLAMGLWYLFDRTLHGFLLSTLFATVGTWVGFVLVANGAYTWTKADFFGVRSWLPCILYCAAVCFGAIGRQMELINVYQGNIHNKRKIE